jgi:predicted dehydrogenase
MRLALIGIDHGHARAYQETLLALGDRVEVVGLWGPRREALARATHPRLAEVPVYDSLDRLVDGARPQAVMSFLRNDESGPVLHALARAGVHVWAEKPVARRAAELVPARDALNQRGLVFATGYTHRFAPVHRQLKRWIDEGVFGPLTGATALKATSSVTARDPHSHLFDQKVSGGGILHWLGCHWIDLFLHFFAEPVVAVAALTGTLSGEPIDVEDVAAVSLRFAGGALVSIHAGYLTPRGEAGGDSALRVYGKLGWAVWQIGTDAAEVFSAHPAWATGPTRRLAFGAPAAPGYAGVVGRRSIENFLAAAAGDEAPMFRIEEAMNALAVCDAAYESARSGRVVKPEWW